MYPIKVEIKHCKSIHELRDFMRLNNIRLVLFAETHGFLKETQIQKKIIESINPDFFLYEMLEESQILNDQEAHAFLDRPNKEDFSFISTYGDLKPTIKLARSFKLPIIGCDIKNMCCDSKNWMNESFPRGHWGKVTKTREARQSKIINQYSQKGLVFATLGAYHLRKGSYVIKNLDEKKFILVNPLFNGGEKFLIPRDQKKLKVSFKVRLFIKK